MARSAAAAGAGIAARPSRRRRIVTPEGVAIEVTLATLGRRAGALLVDLVLVMAVFIGLLVAPGYSALDDAANWLALMGFAGGFVLRTFYFMFFELTWQGRTPGKRLVGLRVMSHDGAPLTAGAVMARNLTREVEFFLPLIVLLALLVTAGRSGAWEAWLPLAALGWLGLFALMPMFNAERRRVGDMIGGTWVVEAPRAVLLDDMGEATSSRPVDYTFAPEQLREYGVHELQVLEEVLRLKASNAADIRREVALRIKHRIRWQPPPGMPPAADPRLFLEAYYAALRGNLEAGMLMGRHRLRKSPRGSVPPSPR